MKRRYWVCDDCAYWAKRKKAEEWRACPKCKGDMRKARKYPVKIAQKLSRIRERERQERERQQKRHAVPRTCYGYRLRLSGKTKEAFRTLGQARQRRSFARRGQAFLDALRDDIWTCPHYHGYIDSDERRKEVYNCDCLGGGFVNAPTFVVEDRLYANGVFGGGLLRGGLKIQILWGDVDRLGTVVHEVTHWVDNMSDADKASGAGSHSQAFKQRMADIAKQLGYNGKL